MPDKKTTQELNELSLLVFGKKYQWRKLRKQGIVFTDGEGQKRRMPLTVDGARQYMEKTLEMRKKISEGVQTNEDR